MTKYLLARYNWNAEEMDLLKSIGYEGIAALFDALDDTAYNKLCDYFTGWLMGENPKARLNYWTRKTGISEAMLNIWYTA